MLVPSGKYKVPCPLGQMPYLKVGLPFGLEQDPVWLRDRELDQSRACPESGSGSGSDSVSIGRRSPGEVRVEMGGSRLSPWTSQLEGRELKVMD